MTNIVYLGATTTKEAPTKDNEAIPAEISDPRPVNADDIALHDPSMPIGYALFNDGIYFAPADDDSSPHVHVCSPLRVEAVFSNKGGTGWGKVISVKNSDGDWRDLHITNQDLTRSPNEVLSRLIDHGLELATGRKAKEQLFTLLKQWKPDVRMTAVNKLGWVGDDHAAFAMPDGAIGTGAVIPMISSAGLAGSLTCKETVGGWKDAVGMKCRDNPMMILAVSLAFSGPLLSILGLGGGGLHFRGSSSSGKTTLLRLAASVWGSPDLVAQWRATGNGLEGIASTLNDMLLPLDEIAEISARELGETIYMLANGTGKVRMTKAAASSQIASWRLALISSGEISVEEKLNEANKTQMAGQEVRLIDIEADARCNGVFDALHGSRNGSTFSNELKNATTRFHGQAGRAFVNYIIRERVRLGLAIAKTVRGIQDIALSSITGPLSGQVSRVAERFAVIGTAGEVATNAGITGWDKGAATRAAIAAFHDWYDGKHGDQNDAAADFATPLKAFIAANVNALCAVGSATPDRTVIGWQDKTRVYLSPETWASIFPGTTGTEAAKALIASNLLYPGEDKRLMRKAPRGIPDRPRLYTVNSEGLAQFAAK